MIDFKTGLSPRVRGRFVISPIGNVTRRFIPRVCGVDGVISSSTLITSGLSPRVRGRWKISFDAGIPVRFIPACAG